MSIKVSYNSLSVKDETTKKFLPIGMFSSGGDKSLKEIKSFADSKKQETIQSLEQAITNLNETKKQILSSTEQEFNDIKNTKVNEFNTASTNASKDIDDLKTEAGKISKDVSDLKKNLNSFKDNFSSQMETIKNNAEGDVQSLSDQKDDIVKQLNTALTRGQQLLDSLNSNDNKISILNLQNPWYGKKIGFVGTAVGINSFPNENSYIEEAQQILGFDLVEMCTTGLKVHEDVTGYPLIYSKNEYKNNLKKTIPTDKTQEGYYGTWENVFSEENQDIDLWLFAINANNNAFGTSEWSRFMHDAGLSYHDDDVSLVTSTDTDDQKKKWYFVDDVGDLDNFENNRETFLGGLIYLLDKLYALNPNARVAFIIDTYANYKDRKDQVPNPNYSSNPSSGRYILQNIEGAKSCLQLLSNSLNIPVIDLWKKSNVNAMTVDSLLSDRFDSWCLKPDMHKMFGKMLAGELLSIS